MKRIQISNEVKTEKLRAMSGMAETITTDKIKAKNVIISNLTRQYFRKGCFDN